MDRSLEMRLRLDISHFQRNARQAAGDMDALIARAALLDAALDRVEASSRRAGSALRDYRTEVQGAGRDADRTRTSVDGLGSAFTRANTHITAAERSLNNYNNTARRTPADMTLTGRTSAATGRQFGDLTGRVDTAGREIDRFSGRVSILVDGLLTLTPALIPVGALAGQAAFGLLSMATAAGVAGASLVVAFQGVGDAYKALEKYREDPTSKNFAAAHQALEDLTPAAATFLGKLNEIRPVLDDLQSAPAAGWFPGLTRALDGVDELAPRLERLLFRTGRQGGFLIADAVDSLAGPRWEKFFDYLTVETPVVMASLSRIMGDLTHGLAEMMMAFTPGNDSFIGWVEDVANGFDRWASSDGGREDIEGFLAYARQNGPAVQEFFTTLVGALGAIVQAAAPLGGPVLSALTAIAGAIETIADSDIATPLLAGLAALRLFNRAQAATIAGQSRLGAFGAAGPGQVGFFGAFRNRTFTGPDAYAQQQAYIRDARRALIRGGTTIGAGALGAGLLASGAADNMGLTNTAMMTMIGTMAGPWGAAVGAGAGLLMDFAAANDEVESAVERANAAIDSGDFNAMAAGVAAARSELDKLRKDSQTGMFGTENGGAFDAITAGLGMNNLGRAMDWWKGKQAGDAETDLQRLEKQMQASREAAGGLAESIGMTVGPLDGSARSTAELERALLRAEPAMAALNLTQADLVRLQAEQEAIARARSGNGSFMDGVTAMGASSLTPYDDALRSINERLRETDTAAGRMSNLSKVISDSGGTMLSAAEAADQLKQALDDLLSPQMNATRANDDWIVSLRTLKDELAKNKELLDDSNAAITNRQAVQDRIVALQEKLVANAGKGAGQGRLTEIFKEGRRELIKFGEAAGLQGDQLRRFLNQQGLTWKVTKRLIEDNAATVRDNTKTVSRAYAELPDAVQTKIRTEGIPRTASAVDALVDKYELSERQRTALMTLRDLASGKARAIDALLNSVARDRQSTITTFLRTVRTNNTLYDDSPSGRPGPRKEADGGLITGPGGPRDDRIPALLSNGEFVVNAAATSRNLGLLHSINAQRFAAGGMVGARAAGMSDPTGMAGSAAYGRGRTSADDFAKAVRDAAEAAAAAAAGIRRHGDESEKASRKIRIERLERSLDRARDRASAARDLRSQVGGSLAVGELFGNGLSGFDAALAANTNDTAAGRRALAQLRKKGLGGKDDSGGLYQLLAASGDLQTLQQFADLTPSQIRAYERRYASLSRGQSALGGQAVLEQYGRSVQGLDRTVDQLRKELRQLRKDVREGAREGTRQGSREGATDRSRLSAVRHHVGV